MRNDLKSFGLLFFVVVVLVGCGGATEDVVQGDQETAVSVVEAERGSLSGRNQFTGKTVAASHMEVIPKSQGELVEVSVRRGEMVEKGQTLARIDDYDMRMALEQERSSLRQAEMGLNRARNGLTQANADSRQSQSQVNQAKAGLDEAKESQQNNIDNLAFEVDSAEKRLNEAKRNLERMEELYDDGLISMVELEEAESAEDQARSGYDQVKLSLEQAKSETPLQTAHSSIEQAEIGVDVSRSRVSDAENGVTEAEIIVEQSQRAVEMAEKSLDDVVIKAPVSGKIASIFAEVGERVSTQGPFAELISVDTVNATFNVTAQQLVLFDVGDSVDVLFAGVEDIREGTVEYIAPTADDSGMFTVEAEVTNESGEIFPGMIATVSMDEVLVAESMIVLTDAIVERSGETYVFIIEGNKAVRQDVIVERYDTEFTAVSGKINDGDLVVIRGQNLLSDGDQVRIIEEDK